MKRNHDSFGLVKLKMWYVTGIILLALFCVKMDVFGECCGDTLNFEIKQGSADRNKVGYATCEGCDLKYFLKKTVVSSHCVAWYYNYQTVYGLIENTHVSTIDGGETTTIDPNQSQDGITDVNSLEFDGLHEGKNYFEFTTINPGEFNYTNISDRGGVSETIVVKKVKSTVDGAWNLVEGEENNYKWPDGEWDYNTWWFDHTDTDITCCHQYVFNYWEFISISTNIDCHYNCTTSRTNIDYLASSEYSTQMLKSKVDNLCRSRLNSNNWSLGIPEVKRWMSESQDHASEIISKYRIKIPAGDPHKKYKICYQMRLIRDGRVIGADVNVETQKFNGRTDSWYWPSDGGKEMDVSQCAWAPCPLGGETEVLYMNPKLVEIDESNNGATPTPGSGSVSGDYGGNSNCQSCSSYAVISYPSFKINMGPALGGGAAGSFSCIFDKPSFDLYTPEYLSFSSDTDTSNGIEVVRDTNGFISQVLCPTALADICIISSNSYQINVYLPEVKGAWNGSKYMLINSNLNFISSWLIDNPDFGYINNRIRITKLVKGESEMVWIYSYDVALQTWTLNSSLGSFQISNNYDSEKQTTSVTASWLNEGNTIIYSTTSVSKKFVWGEGIIKNIIGVGVDAECTQYTYYETTNEAGYFFNGNNMPLKSVLHADGSWIYYLSYDPSGRPTQVLYGVDSSITTNPNLSRSITYSYDSLDSRDDLTRSPSVARVETESFKGTVISKTFRVYTPTQTITKRAANANDTFASASLVSLVEYYDSGDNAGAMKSVTNPNGTMTIYSYSNNSDGNEVRTESSGQPSADGGSIVIVDGTSYTKVFGVYGEILTNIVTDIQSGLVLSKDIYVYSDVFKKSYTVTHLDQTTETFSYACCGLDLKLDRDGVVTQFLYDGTHRLVGNLRLGVYSTNMLDAAGRVLMSMTVGSDGSKITNNQYAYNTAGRMILATNALLGVTSYSRATNSTGAIVETVTNPDSGTIVTTYNVDGTVAQVEGAATHGISNSYGVLSDGTQWTKIVKLGGGNNEWTKTYVNMLGQKVKTEYSASGSTYPYEQWSYLTNGLLNKYTDLDGIVKLCEYNSKAELWGADNVDLNLTDLPGQLKSDVDRMSRYITGVSYNTYTGNSTRARLFRRDPGNSINSITVNSVETSLDGLKQLTSVFADGQTPSKTLRTTTYGTTRTVNTVYPDNSKSVDSYISGRLASSVKTDANNVVVSSLTYGYDSFGRVLTVTDSRNGTTVYHYNAAGLVDSLTTPDPRASGGVAQVTRTYYDSSMRVIGVVNPDGSTVTNSYYQTGELQKTSGSRTYPVAYTYDYAGRMKTMQNWSSFSTQGGSRITTWNYDPYRGWLISKDYPDPVTGAAPATSGTNGPVYTYTAGGRLNTRSWARGVTTTYKYGFNDAISGNQHGDLTLVTYSDSTPSVAYTYDRWGRITTVTTGATNTTFLTYDYANELTGISNSAGTLAGLTLTNVFDINYLRRSSMALTYLTTPLDSWTYGYASAPRLTTVSEGGLSATYSYLGNSALVGNISFKQGTTERMRTSKVYDMMNRLQSITSTTNGTSAPVFSDGYLYNNANQRVRTTLADGSYWDYRYDELGQVISGKHYWIDGSPVAGQQYEYGFDDIGNRKYAKSGGDETGLNLRTSAYTSDFLNRYSSRTVPATFDVIGTALATNTVSINGNTPYRKGEYYRQQLSVATQPAWTSVTVASPGQTSISGNNFTPSATENYNYDKDGNLLSDGRWTYTWDGENRLITMTANTTVAPQQSIQYEYDWQGRRVHKQVWANTNASGIATLDQRYIYDGWNLIAVVATNNNLSQSYTWGSDLSGSEQGAGGVGGLLWIYDANTMGSASRHFAAYDGNGNLTGLVNASDGTTTAAYEYGPFGEVIRATGPMAKANPFRFSTKYQDDETDLLYYGYRYYNPSTGRWLSRDPIEEIGGFNLYGFAGNQPVNKIDRDGRVTYPQQPFFNVSLDTHHYYSDVFISFTGGHTAPFCPQCQKIKLAQIVITIYEGLYDNLTHSEGWKLDTDKTSSPWYPYQQSQYNYASMVDAPGMRWYYPIAGEQLYGLTQMFETCAYCTDKGYEGFLGCASWGHSVGGLRASSNWGGGTHITPVPPSEIFKSLSGLK